jgi:hypothetical protein
MGLRNGVLLNAMCPGKNGPHDLDAVVLANPQLHVLHSNRSRRLAIIDYKASNAAPIAKRSGTNILYEALAGSWEEPADGFGKAKRRLEVRVWYLDEGRPEAASAETFAEIRAWLWPDAPPWPENRTGHYRLAGEDGDTIIPEADPWAYDDDAWAVIE